MLKCLVFRNRLSIENHEQRMKKRPRGVSPGPLAHVFQRAKTDAMERTQGQ